MRGHETSTYDVYACVSDGAGLRSWFSPRIRQDLAVDEEQGDDGDDAESGIYLYYAILKLKELPIDTQQEFLEQVNLFWDQCIEEGRIPHR